VCRDLFVAIVRARTNQRKIGRGEAASSAISMPKGRVFRRSLACSGAIAPGLECVAPQDRSSGFSAIMNSGAPPNFVVMTQERAIMFEG